MIGPHCKESVVTRIPKDISGQAQREKDLDKKYEDMPGQDKDVLTVYNIDECTLE
jgi:hypothetical protein